jgi:hypothetical protein
MTSRATRNNPLRQALRSAIIAGRAQRGVHKLYQIGGRSVVVYVGETTPIKGGEFRAIEAAMRTGRQEGLVTLLHAHTALHILGNKDSARYWLGRAPKLRLGPSREFPAYG